MGIISGDLPPVFSSEEGSPVSIKKQHESDFEIRIERNKTA
jgi:hypothetical protein